MASDIEYMYAADWLCLSYHYAFRRVRLELIYPIFHVLYNDQVHLKFGKFGKFEPWSSFNISYLPRI